MTIDKNIVKKTMPEVRKVVKEDLANGRLFQYDGKQFLIIDGYIFQLLKTGMDVNRLQKEEIDKIIGVFNSSKGKAIVYNKELMATIQTRK